MYYFRIVLIHVFGLLSIAAYSQHVTSATITGKITSSDGEAMPGVAVHLEHTSHGTQTDENGAFHLRHIEAGNYKIVFTSIGYMHDTSAIRLSEGQVLELNKTLHADTANHKEIVITGKTEVQELKESEFSVNSIDTKQFANTTADLNQILNRSAGIKVRESGGTGSDFNFSINGLSGKSIKYFMDGIPMDVMGGSMTLNNIPVNLAERIDVYKGVVPVSLGSDAMGGAVNMITSQKIKRYLDASYSYGSFNTHRAALCGQHTFDKTGIVVRANMFYNFSTNNYIMKNVQSWDAANNEYVNKNFRRFHDHYQAGMGQIELGVMNKKWADLFFVGVSYSRTNQDIQTGALQDVVYGAVTKNGYSYNTSLRWKKDSFLLKNLHANGFISRSFDTYQVTDTTPYRYSWDGSRIFTGQAEQGGAFTLTHITRPKIFARLNLSYDIVKNHTLNINYTLDRTQNQNYNALLTDKDYNPGVIAKQIIGLAYQQQLINKRLTNTFFGKYYGLGISMPHTITGTNTYENLKDFKSYYGYGIATRFKVTKDAGIKASFEQAYRLQEVEELFGNGYTVIANPDLKPENSRNLNAGLYYGKTMNKHSFFIEGGIFNRNAKDFIYKVIWASYVKIGKYENTSNVKVNGIEGEIRYTYSNLIIFSLNASYQNAINNTKYVLNSSAPDATYLNRIPNQPWVFGNADLGIGKNDVLGKDSRIQFNWSTQYVHWYFLTWEGYGNPDDKNKIPTQWVQNASVSYSCKKGKYNISFECRNIADALVYDNFKLQKPGRAFSIKLRYHFQ